MTIDDWMSRKSLQYALWLGVAIAQVACRSSDPEPVDDRCAEGSLRLPGEACKPIGVVDCAAGFSSDGKGGCNVILPKEACAEGTMAVPGDATCVPVGVKTCGAGFVTDGQGGCDAVLPKDPCPSGTMAVPGDAKCREVAPCGTGTWGDIPADASTLYVDAAFVGASDGSKDKPFTTIQAGIDAADGSKRPIVAIAAGTYVETVRVNKPVRLFGRCPALVTIKGPATAASTIAWSADAELHGVGITGDGGGIYATRGKVLVEDSRLYDLGDVAVSADSMSVTIRRTLLERATTVGLLFYGIEAIVEGSVIRDTRPRPSDGIAGYGIQASPDVSGVVTNLALGGSLLAGNRAAGLQVFGSKATLTATVVRDTLPKERDSTIGIGVSGTVDSSTKLGAELIVRQSLLVGNMAHALAIVGSKATVESTVIRDTKPEAKGKADGDGISASGDPKSKLASELIVKDCLLAGNTAVGIGLFGATATIDGSLVRDTLPRASDDLAGLGLHVAPDPRIGRASEVTLTRSKLLRNRTQGIAVWGSKATLVSSVVRDTLPEGKTNAQGSGIYAAVDPTTKVGSELVLRGSLIAANHTMGIQAVGTQATIDGSVVRDTKPRVSDSDLGFGIAVRIDDETDLVSTLVLRGSTVSGNTSVGVSIQGAVATIDSSVIRDTKIRATDGKFGYGLQVARDTRLGLSAPCSVVHTLVDGNSAFGAALIGTRLLFDSSIVRGTLAVRGKFGDGVIVMAGFVDTPIYPAELDIRTSLFDRNARAGVTVFGGKLRMVGARLRCGGFDLDVETVETLDGTVGVALEDAGGNECGCGEVVTCKAETGYLEALHRP